MHAFEVAVHELSLKPNHHVLLYGILPTWHEFSLLLEKLPHSDGLVLCVDEIANRVHHVTKTIDDRGLTGKIIAYTGTFDVLYGSVVAEESVDALIYVPQHNDDSEAVVREIKRIIKPKGHVALIEKTVAHPLTKGTVNFSYHLPMLGEGLHLVKTITADPLHTVCIFKQSL